MIPSTMGNIQPMNANPLKAIVDNFADLRELLQTENNS
jgi:hypothetical protein